MDYASSIHHKTGGKRVCSGLWSKYAHGQKDHNSAELETMRISKNPTTVMTANGVQNSCSSFLGETLRRSWVPTTGPVVKNHISPKIGKKSNCKITNYVPLVVPGFSASSSTSSSPASSTSSSQDAVMITTENPATERSEIVSEESLGNRRADKQKPKTHMKMKTTKNYEVNCCKICRNGYRISKRIWWIRMFNHINTLPALLMNSHELPMEPRAYVEPGSGKHNVCTHFPKDENCDIWLRTKITRASCRRRAGTVVPRAEHFWSFNNCGSKKNLAKDVNLETIIDTL